MTRYMLPSRLFVTGTSTDIGKTVVSAILMCGTRGMYWKPVQSGLEEMTDTQWIQQVTGLSEKHFFPERYRLRRPLSPHLAAALDGVRIALDAFLPPDPSLYDHLIIEGAGGILVPLNDRHFMLDLMLALAAPVLVVASSRLGTINHTLLTLEKLKERKAVIAGVVMNGPRDDDNRRAIEHYGGTRVVAQIEPLPDMRRATMKDAFSEYFECSHPA